MGLGYEYYYAMGTYNCMGGAISPKMLKAVMFTCHIGNVLAAVVSIIRISLEPNEILI
jgi:hypothetical protein